MAASPSFWLENKFPSFSSTVRCHLVFLLSPCILLIKAFIMPYWNVPLSSNCEHRTARYTCSYFVQHYTFKAGKLPGESKKHRIFVEWRTGWVSIYIRKGRVFIQWMNIVPMILKVNDQKEQMIVLSKKKINLWRNQKVCFVPDGRVNP